MLKWLGENGLGERGFNWYGTAVRCVCCRVIDSVLVKLWELMFFGIPVNPAC